MKRSILWNRFLARSIALADRRTAHTTQQLPLLLLALLVLFVVVCVCVCTRVLVYPIKSRLPSHPSGLRKFLTRISSRTRQLLHFPPPRPPSSSPLPPSTTGSGRDSRAFVDVCLALLLLLLLLLMHLFALSLSLSLVRALYTPLRLPLPFTPPRGASTRRAGPKSKELFRLQSEGHFFAPWPLPARAQYTPLDDSRPR